MILALSQTAASPVTCSLSCRDEVRKEDVVVAVIETEDVGEDEEEEAKPAEDGGNLKYI